MMTAHTLSYTAHIAKILTGAPRAPVAPIRPVGPVSPWIGENQSVKTTTITNELYKGQETHSHWFVAGEWSLNSTVLFLNTPKV